MDYQIYNLLEKKHKILCRMIDVLHLESSATDVHTLSQYLELNERSVQRYIHDLEELIDNFNTAFSAQLKLEYAKFKGVNLEFNGYTPYTLKNYLLENDITIMIFLDLIFDRVHSIQSYAREQYISESLVRSTIKRINQFAQEFNVQVKTKEPFFNGEEVNIRLCFFIFLWSLYKDRDWPFQFIAETKIYDSIDTFSTEADLYFSTIHKKQIAYLLAINILRFHKKYFIAKDPLWDDYINIIKLKEVTMIQSGISKYNVYDEGEIYFYLLLIQMKTKIYDSEEVRERILNYHEKTNSDIFRLTTQCVELFSQYFFPIPKNRNGFIFIYLFCANLYCRIFRHVTVDIDGYILSEDQVEHKELIIKINHFLDSLYDLTKDPIFLEKEYLIGKYYMLVSAFENPIHYEKQINILLASDLPLLIRNQLKRDLYNYFDRKYNIYLCEHIDECGHVEIILTNLPSTYPNQRVCAIDYPLSEYNFKIIEQNIAQVWND